MRLFLCKRVGDARKTIAAYNGWRREWQEMSGDAPSDTEARASKPGGNRALIGALVWLLLFGEGKAPGTAHDAASLAFLLLTLWGLWGALRRFARLVPYSFASDARAVCQHVVSLCLPVPARSATPKECTRAHPDYCRALLAGNGPRPR